MSIQHTSILSELRTCAEEVINLRKQTSDLRDPEHFVQFAKLNREINRKEKQRETLAADLQSVHQHVLHKLLQTLKFLFWIGMFAMYRNLPIAELGFSGGRLFSRFLNIGCDEDCRLRGEIGLVSWIFLCNTTVNALLDLVFPLDNNIVIAKAE